MPKVERTVLYLYHQEPFVNRFLLLLLFYNFVDALGFFLIQLREIKENSKKAVPVIGNGWWQRGLEMEAITLG